METTARPGAQAEGQAAQREEVSVLMLGREQSGRTSLVLSLEALRAGAFPKRSDQKFTKPELYPGLPDNGSKHVIPPRAPGGLPLVILDTAPCGARDQVRLPGGRRLPIALRSSSLNHDAVLFVLDATDRPLWEDPQRTEELAQLSATLRQQQYSVVIAVTKLLKARETALREVAHGAEHQGRVGRDPRRSYEEFVSRYLEKTTVTLQATQALKTFHASQGDGVALFPRAGVTIFDVPTWMSIRDFEAWKERRGTPELPNLRYMEAQMEKLVAALAVVPVVKSGTPWHQLVDDDTRAAAGA